MESLYSRGRTVVLDQVVAAKAKLETILTDELSKLMQAYIAEQQDETTDVSDSKSTNGHGDAEAMILLDGSAGVLSVHFGMGCGTSTAPAFTHAFLSVLRQTEVAV